MHYPHVGQHTLENLQRITRLAQRCLGTPGAFIALPGSHERWEIVAEVGVDRGQALSRVGQLPHEPAGVRQLAADGPQGTSTIAQPLAAATEEEAGYLCVALAPNQEWTEEQAATLDDLATWAGREVASYAPVERRLFEIAVNQAYDSIVITEPELDRPGPRIVYVNPGFTRMTGYSAAEVVGKTPRILQGPATDRAVLDYLRAQLEKGERFEGETINYRKDGTPYHVSWHIAPIRDETGKIIYFVSIQRDVTANREAQRRLQEARDQLERRVQERTAELAAANAELNMALLGEQEARDQLVQAGKLAAMGRMVASVAHELNNPLQTIKNCLFLLEEEIPEDPLVAEYLSMSLSEAQRLSDLVRQLREVYRPSQSKEMKPVSLPDLLEKVRAIVRVHLERHRVAWEQAPLLKPFHVLGIEDQLKQVFLNISINAIEAMAGRQDGVLAVSVLSERDKDGKRVGVQFRDKGSGLSSESLDNLFDPFYTTKESGMGLGLAISYDIVHRHHGEITVENNEEHKEQGATFTVWLPLLEE